MAQLSGKQIKDSSVSLDKLDGTGGLYVNSTAGITFSTGSILRVIDAPTQNTDVVNKLYVDSVAAGLDPKQSVSVISNSPISLSGTQSIDGVVVKVGDRVLVNGQSNTINNGIYDVSASSWTRSGDSDGNPSNEVSLGNYTFVEKGTLNSGSGWVLVTTDASGVNITPGTNTQVWTKFSEIGQVTAGDGLVNNGLDFSVNVGDGVTTGLTISSDKVTLTNTGVSANTYGAQNHTLVITVDSKGRLTSASTQSINILSTQVSDFSTASKSAIFDTNNFVDSATIDMVVTTGASVSASVVNSSLTQSKFNVSNSGSAGSNKVLGYTASGQLYWYDISGFSSGSGTTNYLSKWNNGQGLVDSTIFDNGSIVNIGSTNSTSKVTISTTGSKFEVNPTGISFSTSTSESLTINDNGIIAIASGESNLYLISGTSNNSNIYYGRTGAQKLNFVSYTESIFMNLDGSGFLNLGMTGNSGDSTLNIGATGGQQIKLYTNNNANKVGISATGSTNWNLVLPPSAGTNNYVLSTDGNGLTNWIDVSTIAPGDITSVVAGTGLAGGGVTGDVTISVADTISGSGLTFSAGVINIGDGAGISVSSDAISLDLVSNGGLTYSTSGAGGQLKVSVDTTSIYVKSNGQLAVATASSAGQPNYSQRNVASAATSGNYQSTEIVLSATPNDAVTVSVYLGGIYQIIGDGVRTTDCYFSSDSGVTAKTIANLTSGDTLYWNGVIAGFDLDINDRFTIIYNS